MKAGRELDALVTEKVMEWNFSKQIGSWYPPGLRPESNAYGHKLPNYSTDIAASWEIVEKLRKNGWGFFIKGDNDGCFASFTKTNIHYLQKGGTASEAICISALKAVEK